jgi:hypothetical protein
MTSSKETINRHILVDISEDLRSTGRVPPVAHQVGYDGKERNELDTGLVHARIGSIANKLACGTGSLDIGEDRVALGSQRQSKEGSAHVCSDTGYNDLLLASGFDGFAKFGVVPSTRLVSERY